ncbi:GNAT family N-acetyltransferase [Streptomyces sp. NPDC096040]|uniref:GNAT family N-acetyltransferase n=1 Tax=Streptomyces sp. NPDC096040 TaxID=3155541 RepID=UPI0033183D2E
MTHVIALDAQDGFVVLPASAALPDGWRATGWSGDEPTCRRQVAERPTAVLETDRLRLREVLPAEAPDLREGRPAGLDWLGGTPGEGSQEAAGLLAGAHAAGRHRPGWGMYVLVRLEDGLVVGGMGFHGPPDDGSVEIGFDLHPDARGRGYATEALAGLAHWALHQPGVDTVLATTTPDNLPSRRVMERAGFARRPDREGVLVYALTR